MVTLAINGQYVVIDGSEMKITKENPRFNAADSYSLDVVLPMSAAENQTVFGSLHRQDVSKHTQTMQAVLTADNRVIIYGIAKVTSVTQDSVKVQLIGGSAGMGVRSDNKKTYIDEIEFPNIKNDIGNGLIISSNQGTFMGYPGRYAFMPTADDKDRWKNLPLASTTTWGWPVNGANALSKLAIQPNLMYVFQYVMRHCGYIVRTNALPAWTEHIYIASSRGTKHIEKALPHWTVQELISEMEKFFGCTIHVDETSGYIDILTGAIDHLEVVEHEIVDEYETEITDGNDGEGKIGGNLEYNFPNNNHDVDCLSDDIKSAFVTLEYQDKATLALAFSTMTTSQKNKFLFHCPVGTYIYHDGKMFSVDQFGMWKRSDSDDSTELKICPVAMKSVEVKNIYSHTTAGGEVVNTVNIFMPVIDNPCGDAVGEHLRRIDKNDDDDWDDGEDTESIEGVLFGDEQIDNGEKEDRMQVMFVDDQQHHVKIGTDTDYHTLPIPQAYTDINMQDDNNGADGFSSWSLALRESEATSFIGQLHDEDYSVIDTAENVFRFLADDIPDINCIFLFRHKRYLCSKLEITITEHGVSPIKTGYFYEMT